MDVNECMILMFNYHEKDLQIGCWWIISHSHCDCWVKNVLLLQTCWRMICKESSVMKSPHGTYT